MAQLRVRPFRRGDAEKIVGWSLDEQAFYKWSAGILGPYPLTAERMVEAMSGRDDNDRFFPFTACDGSEPVGFFILRNVGEGWDSLRFGFVIVDPALRGKGCGKQMLQLGLRYAFEVYGAGKVGLGVFANNPAAYHCYRSLGFRENGETEAYPLNGEVWQCIEMSMDRE